MISKLVPNFCHYLCQMINLVGEGEGGCLWKYTALLNKNNKSPPGGGKKLTLRNQWSRPSRSLALNCTPLPCTLVFLTCGKEMPSSVHFHGTIWGKFGDFPWNMKVTHPIALDTPNLPLTYPPVHPPTYIPTHLHTHLSTHLHVHPSTHCSRTRQY